MHQFFLNSNVRLCIGLALRSFVKICQLRTLLSILKQSFFDWLYIVYFEEKRLKTIEGDRKIVYDYSHYDSTEEDFQFNFRIFSGIFHM